MLDPIPAVSWTRRLDQELDRPGRPSRMLDLGLFWQMLPVYFRMRAYARRQGNQDFDPLNAVAPPDPGPYQGVPLGGIGGGCIGRGWCGDFRRWTLRPGFPHQQIVWADQFSLYCRREGCAPQARVLYPGHPADGALSAWQWDLDGACATYHALFPRAWTVYEPLPGLRLTCRQLSPVIPENYRESSFPCAHFGWRIENTADSAATVALMLTFQNGTGTDNDRAGGHSNRPFRLESEGGAVLGVALRHVHRQAGRSGGQTVTFEDPLTLAIAAEEADGVEVTYRARFDPAGDGRAVWEDLLADGRLDNSGDERPTAPGETIAAALAVTVEVPAHGGREVSFALAWDMPLVRTGLGTSYYRRYTVFYGQEGQAAPLLARDALRQAEGWEHEIVKWQRPIVEDDARPDWYRMALLNELYYIVDGGTLWVYPADEAPDPGRMGHFAYLEGHEYRMYNTYDVHFYASFALAMLWPQLELSLQRDIAAATLEEYADAMVAVYSGKRGRRKVRGAVPHDLGWPEEDPWKRVNGYFFHDVNNWKDLNPKFVLQVYRDYVATGDAAFLAEVWPAVEAALAYVGRFDRDGDGLIENDGFPDQTYDVWTVQGPSAYSGGLWLAALQAGAAIAEALGKSAQAAEYRALFEKGRAAYEERLWNGRYYNYDSSRSRQHDSIMADQLAGHMYARACGLPPVVEPARARRALGTAFAYNVQRFRGGRMGAVNGMRPDGRVDRTSLQSREVWTGTTYALAAGMLWEGLDEEAWRTAEGVARTTYETRGYWFQTPEAWDEQGDFRALAYMRPLSIWAMEWALQRRKRSSGQ